MSAVTCRNLNKKYGAVIAVERFNLEIQVGEFVVLLGPSGCGKSTLLRMIAGLEDITSGEIEIDGVVVNDLSPADRGVAMVFQNYALYPHLTAFDNVAFGLRRVHTPKVEIDVRVQGVAKVLGISQILDRKPAELSGGQQQRVAIARAMIKTPKLFLFDEPLSNLDAKLRNHMRTEIAELHRSLGATSIYVTHDQLEAMTLADRIVLMRGGTIEQIATPHEIYRHPASQFAADFIGNPGMNFLDAGVRRSQDEWSLVLGELSVGLSGRLFHLQENDSVILGIRPQDVIVGESTSHGLGPFTGVVNAVEFHGHDSLVSISLNETKFSALMPAKKAAHKGETISCSIAEEDIHLFSKQTGNSLRRPPKNA